MGGSQKAQHIPEWLSPSLSNPEREPSIQYFKEKNLSLRLTGGPHLIGFLKTFMSGVVGISCLGLSAIFFGSPSCLASKALCQGQSVLLHINISHIAPRIENQRLA